MDTFCELNLAIPVLKHIILVKVERLMSYDLISTVACVI